MAAVPGLFLTLAARAGWAQMAGMEAHQRLDRTMFWTGALLVFTPLVLALAVAGWVLYHRRKRRAEGESDRRS